MKYVCKYLFVIFTGLSLVGVILTGCATKGSVKREVTIEFRLGYDTPKEGTVPIHIPGLIQPVYIEPYPLLTRMDIINVSLLEDAFGPALEFIFTPVGAVRFQEITATNIGNRIVVLVDNQPVAAPIVKEPITAGRAIIAGKVERKELEKVIKAFRK